jgi:hypothetical protein
MDMPIPTHDAHENGGHAFSLKQAIKYAEFFDVNLAWLAEGKLPMKGQGDTTDILDGLPEYIAFHRALKIVNAA